MSKPMIEELFVLRAIACLSILMHHAMNRAFINPPAYIELIELFLAFGTPAYIFISEMILANAYPERIPSGFWSKRLRFIFIPYLSFGALYAVLKSIEEWFSAGSVQWSVLFGYLGRHLFLGDYHGYFILIIFQFYFLHHVFKSINRRYSAKLLLTGAFVIQMAYLAFFNLVPAPAGTSGAYIWSYLFWLPFVGWLFYFVVAYYCGSNYERFRYLLEKYGRWTWAAAFLTMACTVLLYASGILTIASSKRFDMILVTISLSFLICYLVLKTQIVPKPLVTISRYSFGIYLLHPLFLALLAVPFSMFGQSIPSWLKLIIYFVVSLAASMAVANVLGRTRWGVYFVGKLGVGQSSISSSRTSRSAHKQANSILPDRH